MYKFDDTTPEIRWAVDSFQISGGAVFAYGWVLCADHLVRELQMEITYVDGRIELLGAETGLDRPDVAEKWPGAPRNSGFLFFSSIANKPIDSIRLIVERADGGMRVARKLDSFLSGLSVGSAAVTPFHVTRSLARKTWEHLRKLQFKVIITKAKRVLPSLWTTRIEQDQVIALLEQCAGDAALVVDHRLGGGANLFRDRLTKRLNDEGRTVALLTFEPPSLRYHLEFLHPDGKRLNVCVDQDVWFALAASRRFSRVYFNNCVSFPSPERVPEMLIHLVRAAGAKLTIFVHDHYTVCPSHFLLNDRGEYCRLPSVETCRTCLPRIRDGLVSLYRSRDIDDWRRRWQECYQIADEIICFAPSGKALLRSVYPELNDEDIVVQPHDIEAYLKGGYVPPATDTQLKIGVLGNINIHKGSQVVLDLARKIEERRINARICVIGTLVASEKPACIEETGPYRREDLPEIIGKSGIQLALMPSIWPETFSFVMHELIAIGVPVMAFDMGAQAEAAKLASNCRVVPLLGADALLDELIEFSEQLRETSAHQLHSCQS